MCEIFLFSLIQSRFVLLAFTDVWDFLIFVNPIPLCFVSSEQLRKAESATKEVKQQILDLRGKQHGSVHWSKAPWFLSALFLS